MEKEFLLGLMGENMNENIKMIKKKDMECSIGMMVSNIKENGKMGNNMEKGNFLFQKKIDGEKESGIMEKELNGWTKCFYI
jgi:hypothetical protein